MIKSSSYRCVLCFLLSIVLPILGQGCGLLFGKQSKEIQVKLESDENGSENGLTPKNIDTEEAFQAMQEQFAQVLESIEQKDFELSMETLSGLRTSMKNADANIKNHPFYEDFNEDVTGLVNRLKEGEDENEKLVKIYRYHELMSKIDLYIKSMHNNKLYKPLEKVPTDQTLELLNERIINIEYFLSEGGTYQNKPQWQQRKNKLNQKLSYYNKIIKQAKGHHSINNLCKSLLAVNKQERDQEHSEKNKNSKKTQCLEGIKNGWQQKIIYKKSKLEYEGSTLTSLLAYKKYSKE